MKNIRKVTSFIVVIAMLLSLMIFAPTAHAATVYNVGPGQTYARIIDVPLESLGAGDVVNIYYKSTPYNEKFGVATCGTAAAPITIHGVPGPNGELPMIDGNGAVARLGYECGNQTRAVINVMNANLNNNVVIENLEVFNGKAPYTYTSNAGVVTSYVANTAGIQVERGENVTVRNCKIHDCGNGFFVTSLDDHTWGSWVARNILFEGNYVYNNGNSGSMYEHNTYCAAIGQTYQYNHYGPLLSGSTGYGLKDRGSQTVVRYNWIEGGRRQISLDDGEDNPAIPVDPGYNTAFVYGNILIEPDGGFVVWGDDEIISFGGDNTKVKDRLGPLYFYNNTVVTYRTIASYNANNTVSPGRIPRTCFAYLSASQTIDFRNNIYYNAGDTTLTMVNDSGTINMTHDWLSSGWVNTLESRPKSIVNNDGTSITGTSPGFVNLAAKDFHLAAGSACINAGATLNSAVLPANDLVRQYVAHQSSAARVMNGSAWDIGAFEY